MWFRSIRMFLSVVVACTICHGQTKKRSAIQWKPSDCTSPLLLPEGLYDLSQFGKGQYRIDGKMSAGHFDCIYFIFQPDAALNPETVAGATESSFVVKDTKVIWRIYKTIVEGRRVISHSCPFTRRRPSRSSQLLPIGSRPFPCCVLVYATASAAEQNHRVQVRIERSRGGVDP